MELKNVIHFYLGCEVQYEGIINGAELKAELVANKDDIFYLPNIAPVRGIKTGYLKKIDQTLKGHRRYKIGRKGLQTHYNTDNFKPILRPLSDMTEDEMIGIYMNDKDSASMSEIRWRIEGDWLRVNYKLLNIHAGYFCQLMSMSPSQVVVACKKQFDVFGLIESGQAISKNRIQ